MYIARVNWTNKSGKTYQSLWLRENYREDGKVKTRNIANLKDWPPNCGGTDEALVAAEQDAEEEKEHRRLYRIQDMILESGRSYGAAFVVLEMARQLGIQAMLGTDHEGWPLWQVVARVLERVPGFPPCAWRNCMSCPLCSIWKKALQRTTCTTISRG